MQVWVGNRRVGEANLPIRPGQSEFVVHTAASLPSIRRYDMNDISPAVEVQKLVLKITKRRFEIDRFARESGGPEYLAQVFNHHGVLPSDCAVEERWERDSRVYSYPALQLTKDEFEEIFDFDWFRPFATRERDPNHEQLRIDAMRNSFGFDV